MIVDPGDWTYSTKIRSVASSDEMEAIIRWLAENVGKKGVDWDFSFGEWVFNRRDDHVRFTLTWG